MAFKLRCPECREAFPWDPKAAWPRFCPQCRADINNDRDDDDIVMPFIRSSAKVAAVDNVYRAMEAGSEHRAKVAAEMTGASVAEMSSLKITDLKTGGREGDISAVTVNNPISQAIDANPGVYGFRPQEGLQYSQGVGVGPVPNAGAKMRTAIQGKHAELAGPGAVSDRPALETTQPGYRRRG